MAMHFFSGIEYLSKECPFGFPKYIPFTALNIFGYLPITGAVIAIARIAANIFVSKATDEPINLGQCGRAIVEFTGLGLLLLPLDIYFLLNN